MMKPMILAAGLLVCAAFAAHGGDSAPGPEFEAASLKPAASSDFDRMLILMPTGLPITLKCATPDPVSFVCKHMSLRDLTLDAYGIMDYQLNGPGWMGDAKFDIAARVPAGTTREQTRLMLQRLLADRFRMTIHRERKETAVYALRVGPNGHKLQEPANPISPEAGTAPKPSPKMVAFLEAHVAGSHATVSNEDISWLVRMLSRRLGRPVVDETGLKGKYDFDIEFGGVESLSAAPGGGPSPAGIDSGGEQLPSIFQAVQNQLGLKLEQKKVPLEMFVVDQAEKAPAEN